MTTIEPFVIETSEEEIKELKQRLALTRWPDKETPKDWSQGIPLSYMTELHDYWLNEYDWPARLALLNQWPGFKTKFDGLDIHFLHVRSPEPNALPLLMTHGWPGSLVEFQKVIKSLTKIINQS